MHKVIPEPWSNPSANLMDRLSEEILLEVLSYLNLHELSIMARVSNRLNRLSEDPKNLCRISLNWQTGSAHSTTRLVSAPQDSAPKTRYPSTIARFHRTLLFTASRTKSCSRQPTVDVYQLKKGQKQDGVKSVPIGHIASALDFSNLGMVGISEIRVDERCDTESGMEQLPFSNQNSVILVVFYTTGQFAIFQIALPSSSESEPELDVTELYASSEVLIRSGPDGIYHQAAEVARLHYPLLVTCSTDFLLRFYELNSDGHNALAARKLKLDMRSQTCFWPLNLNLTALETGFRLTIVYPTPFYPSAWTVGLQEFEFELSPTPKLLNTRHTTALPFESTKLSRHSFRQMTGVGPVSGIEYAEPTVVVARTDNTLDTFEYRRRSCDPPELLHRRTLFGHTSRVAAVALNSSGRCVSAGQDGLNVWELAEGQMCGPVQVGLTQSDSEETNKVVEWVGFDTEKIVGVLRTGTCGAGEGGAGQAVSDESLMCLKFVVPRYILQVA
ncbi:uncharacterized protein MELLADRAFT_110284 [Melampsora larici-populina 98AG31]|uniref:F-box domain-containing protein n=1 Tax=Melampsora larici-populina (strain 98AG31 / pathotype 3-4-7) TaxID=747676 RepID=F4RZ98_MELLP|nr:uncharacterized protein MELLADRAFT_110284 [Melampsora larici-populina 98AG31]EGG02289.1 hypothetical protein MELLADRAFT_110284 [Melampsora larici-populina 98AG31]